MKVQEIIDQVAQDQLEIRVPDMEFVYHGTPADPDDPDFNPEGFESLKRGVVELSYAFGGYFGFGFYVTENAALARSNYAGRDGYVFRYRINPSRVLDLRQPEHWDKWQRSGLDAHKGDRSMPALAVRMGIDGVYDRSVGGLCIYNPRALTFDGYEGPLVQPA